jgi:hypothetical protein
LLAIAYCSGGREGEGEREKKEREEGKRTLTSGLIATIQTASLFSAIG